MSLTDDYERDEWHRINQMYAAAGLPVVMPEDWAPINALAEVMDETITGPEGYFDTHPVTRAIAGEMVRALVNSERTYDTRWCPDFDESKPRTMVRYYALVYGSATLIPLDDLDQWEEVARTLFPKPRCDAHILHDCYRLLDRGDFFEAETVSMKRGEIICMFNICKMCLASLRWITFGHPAYSGPPPWTDDGSRSSDDDPWRI